jgi:hypothetical protein
MQKMKAACGAAALLLGASTWACAQTTRPSGRAVVVNPAASTLSPLPIREVTVFKDGHAFLLHEGTVPIDERGQASLDNLPTPVLGTFWPFAANGALKSATSARQLASVPRSAVTLIDLIRANIGAEVTLIEYNDKRSEGKILDVLQQSPLVAPAQPNQSQADQTILLQTKDGVRAVPYGASLTSGGSLIFKNSPGLNLATDEWRSSLRLQLNGARREARVGVAYLQKGIRWIPSYRLALGEREKANLQIQATLVNDIADLKSARAHLVIGAPSFAFKDTIDPIALQNEFARLSPYFQAGGFSNAIQSQVASNSYAMAGAPPVADQSGGPAVEGGGANEDFYVYDVENITLAKGERMVFGLGQSEVRVQDIYALDAQAAPPEDVYRALNYQQQRAIASDLAKPNVMHKLRITNSGQAPLTTAPMLIEKSGRVLAQTLMTYTAPGGRSDVDLAPAVDVTLKRRESETKRTPGALKWRGADFARVDVAGVLEIQSYRNEPITVEVTQRFVGSVEKAEGGTIRKIGAGDDELASQPLPSWWNNYGGSDAWRQVNALSSVTWTFTLPAKGKRELPFEYFYFWG